MILSEKDLLWSFENVSAPALRSMGEPFSLGATHAPRLKGQYMMSSYDAREFVSS